MKLMVTTVQLTVLMKATCNKEQTYHNVEHASPKKNENCVAGKLKCVGLM
jgi:hypothetical protein